MSAGVMQGVPVTGVWSAWWRCSSRLGQWLLLAILALAIFGPLLNLLLWAVAEKWYFPHKLPLQYGFSFWQRVFRPQGDAWQSLWLSLLIACGAVVMSLALSIPAGYALARRRLPLRALIMFVFLLPQAFPSLGVYMNVAQIFYRLGLNGTLFGVMLVHTVHGLVLSVWICAAAFASVDKQQEEAARNLGASPLQAFFHATLPQAAAGLMASAIFVFLESMDEFTGVFFVGIPEIKTLPVLLYSASMEGNYQIASITALILLVPSIGFMLMIHRVLKVETLGKIGA
ncbi:ABC transporter permease subunit [Pokkaliibacter sp. MBI-7]|uniref:ABC transporter permease n=1 Tax=Pokkaliibacter sp. MBI-7 TaxID=3040600 RepID=UPI00244958A0|nr:ABC transporter permease subunit [Pokkaliibacter sp. MBI-7]MDH2434669.1 ABC transporter permease subunit [Pokkaliibacter sp. MBI-7]